MTAEPEAIELPDPISAVLIDTVTRMTGFGDRDPQPALDRLPGSMPAGRVLRLAEGGPFGWMLDARADRIDERIALEVCENSRMSGLRHYRVWDDGSVEDLPTEQPFMVFPADCSDEERERVQQEYFAHNRAVYDHLAERGFQ